MIYLNCNNLHIEKHWKDNVVKYQEVKLLDNYTGIFDYEIKSEDILIINLDLFENVDKIIDFINMAPAKLKLVGLRENLSLAEGTLLIKKGLKSYCHLNLDDNSINLMISTVKAGDSWVYPALMNYIIKNINIPEESKETEKHLNKLTAKEKEVALLVASGNSNKEIADSLNVALVTVKKHIGNIFHKLNLKDRVSLSILINS
ncbi:MAG: response regulator transcription factor [Arcobacteraceae bacterium]|nr:response regulator transcription factor [Arcobacteraceae bacterium]